MQLRHRFRFAFLGLAIPAFAACSRAPALRPLAPEAVILAFGDSLTAGTGAEPGESYPDILQQILGRPVINAGVPGELSGDGLARLPALVATHRPALVILCHGGNDLLQRRDPQELRRHLERMIQLLHAQEIDVLLIGVPAPGLFLRPAHVYRDLARTYRLPYAGPVLSDILADRSLTSDPAHPNAAGYRKLAAALARRIATP